MIKYLECWKESCCRQSSSINEWLFLRQAPLCTDYFTLKYIWAHLCNAHLVGQYVLWSRKDDTEDKWIITMTFVMNKGNDECWGWWWWWIMTTTLMNYDLADDYVSDSDNLFLNFWTIKVGFGFSLHFSLLRFCQVHLRNILQDFMTEIFGISPPLSLSPHFLSQDLQISPLIIFAS